MSEVHGSPPRAPEGAAPIGQGRSGERRRFTLSVLAREILRDAVSALTARGIAVIPLKGVLFQLVLYPDPASRLLSDVDILVLPKDFAGAIDALIDAGFEPEKVGRSLIEVALRSPRGLSVDLHRRLFSPGRYKLSTRAVFRRASRDDTLLGVPLHLAHPHDTAAHLVGKLVSDHVTLEARPRLEELARWVEHCRIEPLQLARHLTACGLARAARYAFARGVELQTSPLFFAAALDALPFDPLGSACARFAGATLPHLDGTVLGPLPAHLLNRSLVSAGASAALASLARLRYARMAHRPQSASRPWTPFFAGRKTTIT